MPVRQEIVVRLRAPSGNPEARAESMERIVAILRGGHAQLSKPRAGKR